jgi:hypothetical protein
MPKHSLQPDLDLPSSERRGGLIGRVREALVGRNGQRLPGIAEIAPHQPCVVTPARPAEAQRLLSATIDENRNLTAHVRELEAELRGSSAEVAKLRGQLRGAVQDALTDSLTGLANRRSFDLELAAVVARRSLPAHLVMADIDHFKRVNDTRGHDIGDEVLRIVGEVLLASVRRDTWSPVWAGTSSGSCCHGPARAIRRGSPPACASFSRPAGSSCAAGPRSSIGSRFRSGWPLGMRAKAVPTGMHAPMRRCTRRNAAAATGSASLACSSLSFKFAGRCKLQIWSHISF